MLNLPKDFKCLLAVLLLLISPCLVAQEVWPEFSNSTLQTNSKPDNGNGGGNGNHNGWPVSPVPEPETYGAILVGSLFTLYFVRRKRR